MYKSEREIVTFRDSELNILKSQDAHERQLEPTRRSQRGLVGTPRSLGQNWRPGHQPDTLAKLAPDTRRDILHPSSDHHALHIRVIAAALHPSGAQEKIDSTSSRGRQ